MGDASGKPDFRTEPRGIEDENHGLHECVRRGHLGGSEFCRLCGVELSGGGWEWPAAG